MSYEQAGHNDKNTMTKPNVWIAVEFVCYLLVRNKTSNLCYQVYEQNSKSLIEMNIKLFDRRS